jgi:hypothetical protein
MGSNEQLVEQGLGALTSLTRYHFTLYKASLGAIKATDIEGDVVRQEGTWIYGRYQGVHLAAFFLNDSAYHQEAGGWVRWPVSDVISTLFPWYSVDAKTQVASSLMDEVRDPLHNIREFPPFPIPRSWSASEGVLSIGQEVLHGVTVRHYRYTACGNCYGNMPMFTKHDVWIDPLTARIHKFSTGPIGLNLAPVEPDGIESKLTISRHDDPAVKLPVP